MLKQTSPNREPARGTHRRKSVRVLFAVSVLAVLRGLQNRVTGVFSYTRVRVGRLRCGMTIAAVAVIGLSVLSVGLWAKPQIATAAPANTVNFQARLQSASGSIAADGFYNVRFRLYNASTGGSALWTETYLVSASNGVRTANGYLTSNLGSVTAFPSSINWGQQLYLTMEVGGTGSTPAWDGEMSPRLSLTSVPSAFALNTYNGANGFSSSLSILQPTGGNQIFQIQDQGAGGTYNVCIANSSSCGFASSSGNGNYIQNQTSAAQSGANFWISGTGKAATVLQAPSFDSIAAGNLNIGTTNATSITLGKSGVNTIVAGNLSVGTTSSYGAITLANGAWLTALDSSGTGAINMMSVNANNEIQVGAALNIDGGIVLPTDGGQMTLSDLPISSSAVAGTAQSYTLRVGSSNVLTVYGEADGAGNAQNLRVAIGSSITPAYTLDVGGNARFTGRVIGADAVNSNEFATLSQVSGAVGGGSGNGNYIQNQNAVAQSGANFWISGTGRAATSLLTPSLDTITAGALGIGGTTATSVNIGKAGVATSILGGLTVTGSVLPNGHLNGAQNLGGTSNYWGTTYTNELELYNGGGVGISTSGSDLNIGSGKLFVQQSSGRVGIGTTAPTTALDVAGSISSRENNVRTYNSVYSSYTATPSTTGTLKIVLPNAWTNTMVRFTISGYDYSANAAWTAVVSGYNYQTGSWINSSAEIRGAPAPFSSIRLAYDSVAGKTVLLLGTTSSVWSYPQFSITEVVAGHSNQDAWGAGYSSAFITSETGITNVAAPATQQVAYGQVFLQGGNSFTANTVLGTNDNYSLTLETNNVGRLSIDTSGNVNLLTGALQVGGSTVITSGRVLQNVTYNGGTIGVGYGGTGQTSFTQYGILYGNNTGNMGVTSAGTNGQCLVATTGGAPAWSTCANGSGSGVTLQAAYNNGLGGTTPEIVLDSSRTTLDVQAYSGQTADLFNLRAYSSTGLGVSRFSVTAAGAVTSASSLTVQSGGASISGGLNNNSGNVTNTGSLSGVTGITTSGGYVQSGSTVNTLTGATSINNTLTVSGAATFSGGLSVTGSTIQLSNFFPEYRWRLADSATDTNWKKIADVTLGTGLYTAAAFQVDVTETNCNFGCTANVAPMRFYASAYRSSGAQDVPDSGSVAGPSTDYVRLVRTALGAYELQVRSVTTYRTMDYTVRQLSGLGATITYASTTPTNGSTTGTIYTSSLTGYTQKLPNAEVGGALAVGGALGVQGNVNTVAGVYQLNSITAMEQASNFLRINQSNQFSNGVWLGSSALRAAYSGVYLGSSGSDGQIALLPAGGDTTRRITLSGGTGNINITGAYQINGVDVCTSSGCAMAGGSNSYIQNGTTLQSASFNISGTGSVSSTLNVNGYIQGNSKPVVQTTDGWLRLNPTNAFTSGIYANTGIFRTDGTLQVGASGATLNVVSGGNFTYGTNTLFANTAGNVGIGTITPGSKLAVVGAGGANIDMVVNGRIQTGDGAGQGGIWVDSTGTKFMGANGSMLGFWNAGNWVLNTSSTGVGIGTNVTPAAVLDVAGTSRIKTTNTAAFQVQNSFSDILFNVDTVNSRVGVNVGTATVANLEVGGNASTPQVRISNPTGTYLDFEVQADGQTSLLTDQTSLQFKTTSRISTSWGLKPTWNNPATANTPYAAPAMGDFDGDGDDDMLVGTSTLSVLEWGAAASGYTTGPCTGNNSPGGEFGDLDADGDMDFVCGAVSGSVTGQWYRNTGTDAAPVWTLGSTIPASGNFPSGWVASVADINGDGKLDVIGNSQGNSTWMYASYNVGTISAPSYTSWSSVTTPGMQYGKFSFADVTNDGKLDLIYGSTTGTTNAVNYYANTGTTSSPVWNTGGVGIPIDSTPGPIPTFVDLNSDGLQDIWVAGRESSASYTLKAYINTGTSTTPAWTRNATYDLAQTGGATSNWRIPAVFTKKTMYGARGVTTAAYVMTTSIASMSTTSRVIAANAYQAPAGTVKMYRNTGTNLNPTWSYQAAWNVPTTAYFPVPGVADLDGDGKKDVVIGTEDGISYAYRNSGSTSVPAWTATSSWNVPDVGIAAAPAFGDLNGDGKLDALVGAEDGISYAYHNVGTSAVPAWSRASAWDSADIGDNAAPVLGDLDSDGDLDLIIGARDGNTYAYKNAGNKTYPNWQSKGDWSGTDVGDYAVPTLVDFGTDGDLDMMIGDVTGAVTAQENVGVSTVTPMSLKIMNASASYNAKPTWNNPATANTPYAAPAMGDFDGDGDDDMLVGTSTLSVLEWGAAASGYTTGPCTGNNSPGGEFGDLDADGDMDFVCGAVSGSVTGQWYRNTGTDAAPVWTLGSTIPASGNFPSGWVASVADINGDGKLDVIGNSQGNSTWMYASYNVGTISAPSYTSWSSVTTPGMQYGKFSFADVTNDGKLDLIYGSTTGTTNAVNYYANTGTTSSPVWNTGGVGIPIDSTPGPIPTFVDLNSDGLQDIWVAGRESSASYTLKAYINTGTSTTPAWTRNATYDLAQTGGATSNWRIPAVFTKKTMYGARGVTTAAYVMTTSIASMSTTSRVIAANAYQAPAGTVKMYRNTGTNLNPTWSYQAAWNVPTTAYFPVPGVADLDGDGKKDVVIGTEDGISYAYRNSGSTSVPAWTATSSWNVPDVGIAAAPAFGDLNGDGKLDALVGAEDGISYAYHNVGTSAVPAWSRASAWDSADIGDNAAPVLGDLDSDGDLDLIIGARDGNTYAYKNAGNKTYPNWQSKGDWSGTDVGDYAVPTLVDFGTDGDLDMMIGDVTGAVTAQENVGAKGEQEVFSIDREGGTVVGKDDGSASTQLKVIVDRPGVDALVVKSSGSSSMTIATYAKKIGPVISSGWPNQKGSVEMGDGGIATLYTSRNVSDATYDPVIVKLDAEGNVQWSRVLERTNSNSSVGSAIMKANDGSVIVVTTESYWYPSIWKIKTDGTVVRVNAHNTSGPHDYFNVYGGTVTSQDAIMLVGSDSNGNGALMKFDESGTMIWTRAYDHPTYSITLYDVSASGDGNSFTLVGGGESGSSYLPVVLKTNSNGDILWQKGGSGYGASGGYIGALYSSQTMSDGSSIVAGNEYEGGYVTKYDSSGSIVWSKSFATGDQVYSVRQGTKGNILVGGTIGSSNTAAFLVSFSSNGAFQWYQKFTMPSGTVYGANYAQDSNRLNPPQLGITSDGGVAVALTNANSGYQIVVLKYNADGEIVDCGGSICSSAAPTIDTPGVLSAGSLTAGSLIPGWVDSTSAYVATPLAYSATDIVPTKIVKNTVGAGVLLQVASNGNVCIGLSNCTNKLGVAGSIAASGSITANSTPDIAEYIPAAPDVEAADVVMADPENEERVVKANGAYTTAAVGVISDGTSSFMINPYGNVDGGPKRTDIKPLVLAGRVPVKITGENGPVRPGDYLTTASIPGYAMKATKAGATIGKSLGYFDGVTGDDKGTVLTLVNIGYHDPNAVTSALQGSTLSVSGDATVAGSVNIAQDLNVGGITRLGTLNVTGNATIGGNVSVGGTLTVTGTANVGNLKVGKHILSNSGAPLVAVGSAAGQDGLVTIDGTDIAGTLNITVKARPQHDTTPAEELKAGALADVTFNKSYEFTPRIVVSPTNATSVNAPVYLVKTNTGWQLMLSQAAADGTVYQFDYVIVGSQGQGTSGN